MLGSLKRFSKKILQCSWSGFSSGHLSLKLCCLNFVGDSGLSCSWACSASGVSGSGGGSGGGRSVGGVAGTGLLCLES